MIHLVIALPAEARPLITHYRLQRRPGNSVFPIYAGAGIRLVVSGPGKLASAAAVGYLCALGAGDPGGAAWLNVGVAGHRDHALGAGFLVHSIEERESGRRWYPPRVISVDCGSASLITVGAPERDYPEEGLYDMEGAGFYAMATRDASGELVQCYKVVSDNALAPAPRVDARQVEALIGGQMPAITGVVEALEALRRELPGSEAGRAALDGFLGRWRFSAAERHRLERLLDRHAALSPGRPLEPADFRFCRAGPEVLRALEARLAGLTGRAVEAGA